jgi:hypothetical protein
MPSSCPRRASLHGRTARAPADRRWRSGARGRGSPATAAWRRPRRRRALRARGQSVVHVVGALAWPWALPEQATFRRRMPVGPRVSARPDPNDVRAARDGGALDLAGAAFDRLASMRLHAQGHAFGSLAEAMAKANEPKSGDELAGIAASDAAERVAAKAALADVHLRTFVDEPLLPPGAGRADARVRRRDRLVRVRAARGLDGRRIPRAAPRGRAGRARRASAAGSCRRWPPPSRR